MHAIILALAFAASPSNSATLSVLDFGAVADGVTDDTPAFLATINEAANVSGSTVYAPSGRYLIDGSISLRPSVNLRGDYDGIGRQRGTVLLSTFGAGETDGPGCIVMAPGCTLRNIAIEYPNQDPEASEPVPYPYAIKGSPSSQIEQVYLHNPYQGINLDECHLNLVRNVWGEPLRVGIHCDHTYDISRIENVHFWPYFTLGKPMREWVQQNAVAYEFGRSDWQSVMNCFSYGYHTGFRFFRTEEGSQAIYPAGTTNGSFFGIGAGTNGGPSDTPDVPNITGEIGPAGFVNGYFRGGDNGVEGSLGLLGQGNGGWAAGTVHRVRLTWDPVTGEALVELDQGYTDTFVADFSQVLDGSDNGFSASNSHIFFGANGGSTWDDISIVVKTYFTQHRIKLFMSKRFVNL